MQLSELLGLPVRDDSDDVVGTVVDVRLTTTAGTGPATPKVQGFVISPRTQSSFLGYERSSADRPRVLAALLRWRHRGTFLASWQDVAQVGTEAIVLRAGYTRYSPVLLEAK